MYRSEIKQKNEGGWEFYWDEESRPGVVVLEVRVQKFLDSSLIDVDVHPTYVSMIIKSKVRFFAGVACCTQHNSAVLTNCILERQEYVCVHVICLLSTPNFYKLCNFHR